MRPSRLWTKALAVLVMVFGATLVATSVTSAWRIESNMTEQYEARGRAIAESVASTTAEMLFRDASTIQAIIDQYLEIQGASYVFVIDHRGEIFAHTFVPGIPEEVKELADHDSTSRVRSISIAGMGEFMDIASPILAGRVGYAHVGIDRSQIRSVIWAAMIRQLAVW